MTPRGIRNCNPLNIRRSKDQWKGLAERQQDAAFCQFKSLEYGWRAAFYLLTRTYYHKRRLYTIRTIIRRWAPESENNTEAYINNVSKLTGIDPDEPLGIPSEQPSRWIALGAAMAIQENGLIERGQNDARISSAERENRRAKLNGLIERVSGTGSLDYFAMLRGWEMCRADAQSGQL